MNHPSLHASVTKKGKAALAYNLPCSDNLKPYFCSVKKFEFFKYW